MHPLKAKITKKNLKSSTERPKIRRFWRKRYAKTNKDLGMSRYIQVEYSVFFRW